MYFAQCCFFSLLNSDNINHVRIDEKTQQIKTPVVKPTDLSSNPRTLTECLQVTLIPYLCHGTHECKHEDTQSMFLIKVLRSYIKAPFVLITESCPLCNSAQRSLPCGKAWSSVVLQNKQSFVLIRQQTTQRLQSIHICTSRKLSASKNN